MQTAGVVVLSIFALGFLMTFYQGFTKSVNKVSENQVQGKAKTYWPWYVYGLIGVVFMVIGWLPNMPLVWRITSSLGAFFYGWNTGVEIYKENHGNTQRN